MEREGKLIFHEELESGSYIPRREYMRTRINTGEQSEGKVYSSEKGERLKGKKGVEFREKKLVANLRRKEVFKICKESAGNKKHEKRDLSDSLHEGKGGEDSVHDGGKKKCWQRQTILLKGRYEDWLVRPRKV